MLHMNTQASPCSRRMVRPRGNHHKPVISKRNSTSIVLAVWRFAAPRRSFTTVTFQLPTTISQDKLIIIRLAFGDDFIGIHLRSFPFSSQAE